MDVSKIDPFESQTVRQTSHQRLERLGLDIVVLVDELFSVQYYVKSHQSTSGGLESRSFVVIGHGVPTLGLV